MKVTSKSTNLFKLFSNINFKGKKHGVLLRKRQVQNLKLKLTKIIPSRQRNILTRNRYGILTKFKSC
jgi:hypothetical protein